MIHTQPFISHRQPTYQKHNKRCFGGCIMMMGLVSMLLTSCDIQHQTEQSKTNARAVESSVTTQASTTINNSLNYHSISQSLSAPSATDTQINLDGVNSQHPQSQLPQSQSEPRPLISNYHHDISDDGNEYVNDSDDEPYPQVSIDHFADQSPMIADAQMVGGLGATLIGYYQGMFPCSDCDSIKVNLNLYVDGSTLKSSSFQSADFTPPPTIQSGHYTQDHDIITLSFDNPNDTNGSPQVEHYVIDDNQLILLNTQSDYANSYVADPDYILSRY